MSEQEETRWSEVAIVCPECGNRGELSDKWSSYSKVPFTLTETVLRSFNFQAARVNGVLELTVIGDTDHVDWESGDGFKFQCIQCYARFAIPDEAAVDDD